jgi:membrane fusion protein, multidrug efflux system
MMFIKIADKKHSLPVILLLCLIFAAGCGQKDKKEETKEREVIPVKVLKVELKDIDEAINYVGDVKAEDEALIYPKVSGKVIEKIKEDGSFVTKGDVIAYIDRDEVGLKFEKAPVESPLSGVIGRVYVDIGQNVAVQTPVALVVNMDRAKIDLDVPEKYISRISIGQATKITVDAFPEKEFEGQVTKISPVIDVITRTAPIEITLDNTGHLLKPGMFAKVELVIERHEKAAAVLKESIIGKEPEAYIFVVEDKKAVLKKVILGIRKGPYVEVLDGIKEGDLVVIMGQQRLVDGSLVNPEE